MSLRRSNISTGSLPMSDANFPGLHYLDIDGRQANKTNKITVAQPTLFPEPERRRTVDNPHDDVTPYKIYMRMESMMHPQQERVFCHELSKSKKKVLQSYSSAWKNVRYDSSRPMGSATITKFAKRLNKKCGMEHYEKYSNHDWRVFMVTKLANNPTVSPVDQMSFSRHKHMESAKPYMRPAGNANGDFQRALHPAPLPSARCARRMKREADSLGGKSKRARKSVGGSTKVQAEKSAKSTATNPVRVSKRISERKKRAKGKGRSEKSD